MIKIYDSAQMDLVLASPIDLCLKIILQERLALLAEYLAEWALEDLVQFLIVEPGDRIEAITRELGINPLVNIIDNVEFPKKSFTPSFEFCIARKGWFDLTFALSDSGQGVVLLVPDQDGVEPQLLALCRAYTTT